MQKRDRSLKLLVFWPGVILLGAGIFQIIFCIINHEISEAELARPFKEIGSGVIALIQYKRISKRKLNKEQNNLSDINETKKEYL